MDAGAPGVPRRHWPPSIRRFEFAVARAPRCGEHHERRGRATHCSQASIARCSPCRLRRRRWGICARGWEVRVSGRESLVRPGPPHPLHSSPAEASVRRAPELARTSENEWAGPRRCRRLNPPVAVTSRAAEPRRVECATERAQSQAANAVAGTDAEPSRATAYTVA